MEVAGSSFKILACQAFKLSLRKTLPRHSPPKCIERSNYQATSVNIN